MSHLYSGCWKCLDIRQFTPRHTKHPDYGIGHILSQSWEQHVNNDQYGLNYGNYWKCCQRALLVLLFFINFYIYRLISPKIPTQIHLTLRNTSEVNSVFQRLRSSESFNIIWRHWIAFCSPTAGADYRALLSRKRKNAAYMNKKKHNFPSDSIKLGTHLH